MRALTIQQPWAWAILRGGKDVENRRNRKGQEAARRQFNTPGPVLVHAGQRDAGTEAYRVVKHLSQIDPGQAGLPRSDTAWAYGAFIGIADLVGVHTADQCYDPVTGRHCSLWAETGCAHLQLANPPRAAPARRVARAARPVARGGRLRALPDQEADSVIVASLVASSIFLTVLAAVLTCRRIDRKGQP